MLSKFRAFNTLGQEFVVFSTKFLFPDISRTPATFHSERLAY
jgi:hypothetical protein